MAEWNEDTMLLFLEGYRNEECIWNPQHEDYKNRKKQGYAWARLSHIMDKSIKELKNRKEILMVTFRRHLKKKLNSIRGEDADEIYKPIWFAYELMESFLGPLYMNANNLNAEEIVFLDVDDSEAVEGEEEEREDKNISPPTSSRTPIISRRRRFAANDLSDRQMTSAKRQMKSSERHMTSSERQMSTSKREMNTAELQMSSAFAKLTNLLSKRHNERWTTPKEDDDECDLYSKLLAIKLRNFPPEERQELMYEIDTLFINRIRMQKINDQNLTSLSNGDV